jgi:Limonene-1,2-epoxide hydrolase catalytic domain
MLHRVYADWLRDDRKVSADALDHPSLRPLCALWQSRTARSLYSMRGELPVLGVFEIVDGKITMWRDYCDMRTITAQMSGS